MRADARWMEAARSLPVVDVAPALGLVVQGNGRRGVGPCPACSAERRHPGRHDRRGALGLTRGGGSGWRCHECQASGDVIDLVAYRLRGKRYRELADPARSEVRDWLVRFVGGEAEIMRPREPIPPAPPRRPPSAEVSEVWSHARPAARDHDVNRWLRHRGLDPDAVELLGLVRAAREPLPDWCAFQGRPWTETGHRVIARLYDELGHVRSLHARSIRADCAPGDKAAAPKGFEVSGLVLADPGAVLMLRACAAPTVVVVAEGEPDWMSWALEASDADEDAPAVLGVFSGSWSRDFASRIPDGATVTIATHPDAAGDRYAQTIAGTLAGRCVEVIRWTPTI